MQKNQRQDSNLTWTCSIAATEVFFEHFINGFVTKLNAFITSKTPNIQVWSKPCQMICENEFRGTVCLYCFTFGRIKHLGTQFLVIYNGTLDGF